MIVKNRIIGYFFTSAFTILILLSFTLFSNAQTLYSCTKGGENNDPLLRTINPNTGATLSTTEITLAGETVEGCNGMAKDPITGVCWMLVNVESDAPRILATIDETTGVATEIGTTIERFAGLAFDPLGTLYGVTGDQSGSATPTLYTLSKNDASASLVMTLGNGDNGEAIAMRTSPGNDLMYHASGVGPINVDQIFERIFLPTETITQITYSGDIGGGDQVLDEVASLVFQSDGILLASDTSIQLFSISTTGVVSFIGDTDRVYKGLAFDCGIPVLITNIPTLSEWGLIAMAGIIGIVGFMVLRRRKVTA